MKTLVTTRCVLSQASLKDLPDIASLYADHEVRHFLGGALSAEEAQKAAQRIVSESDMLLFTVRLSETKAFVGVAGFGRHHDEDYPELSYMFGSAYWHKGLAREALTALVTHAFGPMEIVTLIAETQHANSASRRLLERIGMRHWKTLERFGAVQDVYMLDRPDQVPESSG